MDGPKRLKHMFSELGMLEKSFSGEIQSTNIQRICYLAAIAVPVHLVHIIIFRIYSLGASGNQRNWCKGVMITHLVMLLLIFSIGTICYFMRRCEHDKRQAASVISGIVYILYLIFGAVLCSFDQLVTNSITPYMLVCIGIGIIILVTPKAAVVYYLLAYGTLYYLVSLMQPSKDILLSIRTNSILATGIGLCIAIVTWRANIFLFLQKTQIEKQNAELQEKNKQLEYAAMHDDLTGLFKRNYFMQLVQREIERIRRTGKEACIILIDIDHFKNVNDSFGHPAGDSVLREIAAIIINNLRIYDTPSRWGGEEFIILLPETSLDNGIKAAEKLKQCIEAHSITVGDKTIKITASLGVGVLTDRKDDGFNKVYYKIDEALYQAKKNGRNRVESV